MIVDRGEIKYSHFSSEDEVSARILVEETSIFQHLREVLQKRNMTPMKHVVFVSHRPKNGVYDEADAVYFIGQGVLTIFPDKNGKIPERSNSKRFFSVHPIIGETSMKNSRFVYKAENFPA